MPVVGSVQLGALLCDSLAGAEDATMLSFAIPGAEIVTAKESSYMVVAGDAFSDAIGRKVTVAYSSACQLFICTSGIRSRAHVKKYSLFN